MSWENAIQTILGVVFRLLEKWRGEEKERRMKHFEDIRKSCLKPLFGELGRLKEKHFTLKESEPWWCEFKIEELLKNPWWETYSFKNAPFKSAPAPSSLEKSGRKKAGIRILPKEVMMNYEILYEDLKNHYPELYRDLQELESLIKTKYEAYLRTFQRFCKTIEDDPEFKELEKQFKKPYVDESSYLHDAVVFLALGVDKSHWPNIYSYFGRELDRVLRLGNKFYNSAEARELRNLINEFRSKIDACVEKIGKIELKGELKGKCEYC